MTEDTSQQDRAKEEAIGVHNTISFQGVDKFV